MQSELTRNVVRLFLRTFSFGLFSTVELYDLLGEVRRGGRDLDVKIDRAVAALKSSSQVVQELEETLEERTERLAKLRREVARLSKLASIEEEKAKPLLHELEQTVVRGRGRERAFTYEPTASQEKKLPRGATTVRAVPPRLL